MKKLLLVLLALGPILCSAQDTLYAKTSSPTGRTRTVNSNFTTIYSPTTYKGFCEEMEYKVAVGTQSYTYWTPVIYYRYIAPFKKRKNYKPAEIYNMLNL